MVSTHEQCCRYTTSPCVLRYIFDRTSLNKPESQLLRDEPSLPLAFLGTDVDLILSVGGPGAGTQYHKHSDGFSVLLSVC